MLESNSHCHAKLGVGVFRNGGCVFLTFLVLTAFQNRLSSKRKLYNSLGLVISSSYLLLTLCFKGVAHYKISKALDQNNIEETYENIQEDNPLLDKINCPKIKPLAGNNFLNIPR